MSSKLFTYAKLSEDFDEHKKQAKGLIKTIETVLQKINLQRTASNLLIFARRN